MLPPTGTSTPLTVMIIDDDPGILQSLEALLGQQGIRVEGFTDPITALHRLSSAPTPDLVLSDCLMPELTGAELVEALSRAGVKVPVVLMTALSEPEFCVDVGRVRVLTKPFQMADLLTEIDASLRPASSSRASKETMVLKRTA